MSEQAAPARSTTFTTIAVVDLPELLRQEMIRGGKQQVCVTLIEAPVPRKYLTQNYEKPGRSTDVTVRRYGWDADSNVQRLGHLYSPEHDDTRETCLVIFGLNHGEIAAPRCEQVVAEIQHQPNAAVFILVCSHMAHEVFEFLNARCPANPKGAYIVVIPRCKSIESLDEVETRLTALPQPRG